MNKVGIIGTGAYGLALATVCHNNNHEVICYTKFKEEFEMLTKYCEHKTSLPGIIIPNEITITMDFNEIMTCDLIIVAVPISSINEISQKIKEYDYSNKYFCFVSKGIEQQTNLLVHEIFLKHVKTDNIAIISGPSFAIDVIKSKPQNLTIASLNNSTDLFIKNILCNHYFNLVSTSDLIGVELCGALKNVIAIISGIIDGLNLGESCNAIFLTKAINELKSIILSLGGKEDTIYSYAGIGDLILTCQSKTSRNYMYGYLLVENKNKAKNYLQCNTVEGIYTINSITSILKEKSINNTLVNIINEMFNTNNFNLITNYLKK